MLKIGAAWIRRDNSLGGVLDYKTIAELVQAVGVSGSNIRISFIPNSNKKNYKSPDYILYATEYMAKHDREGNILEIEKIFKDGVTGETQAPF